MLFKNWGKIYSIPSEQRAFIHFLILGNLIRKSACTVSFRCLPTLLKANVRILTALETTALGSPHVGYREFFLRVRNHVTDGMSLPESFLMESHWLGEEGRMVAAMIQIAGKTRSAIEIK